jgi:hypothetical protein
MKKENQIKEKKDYPELSLDELANILDLTIKQDKENKIITFLCQLSAFTENSQFNVLFNAPSSTGKSYIPTEIANLFPSEDVIELSYCSPTAFFHDQGHYDKEKLIQIVDLSRKILIFLDQPHNDLLARLRPVLSHDRKELISKITDKNQKFGLRTKTIKIIGYPSVIFCTAKFEIDEQEATRFILLSPEINSEKIKKGVNMSIKKAADPNEYISWLDMDPNRSELKERIIAIRDEKINEIIMPSIESLETKFLERVTLLKPRHQRDIKRIISFAQSIALLNLWNRERDGNNIIANESDVDEAFKIWDEISFSQELNLPPYIYNLFNDVIVPAWIKLNMSVDEGINIKYKNEGLSRQEILNKHYDIYGKMLEKSQFIKNILPMMETAGLIYQENDKNGDKRRKLIYPFTNMLPKDIQNNMITRGGVTEDSEDSSE